MEEEALRPRALLTPASDGGDEEENGEGPQIAVQEALGAHARDEHEKDEGDGDHDKEIGIAREENDYHHDRHRRHYEFLHPRDDADRDDGRGDGGGGGGGDRAEKTGGSIRGARRQWRRIEDDDYGDMRIAVLVPFSGTGLPVWFDLFLDLAEANKKLIDWILFCEEVKSTFCVDPCTALTTQASSWTLVG